MLLLLIVGNYTLGGWSVLQWNNIFMKIDPLVQKPKGDERASVQTQRQKGDFISLVPPPPRFKEGNYAKTKIN
jgi:hypothetical protein